MLSQGSAATVKAGYTPPLNGGLGQTHKYCDHLSRRVLQITGGAMLTEPASALQIASFDWMVGLRLSTCVSRPGAGQTF